MHYEVRFAQGEIYTFRQLDRVTYVKTIKCNWKE